MSQEQRMFEYLLLQTMFESNESSGTHSEPSAWWVLQSLHRHIHACQVHACQAHFHACQAHACQAHWHSTVPIPCLPSTGPAKHSVSTIRSTTVRLRTHTEQIEKRTDDMEKMKVSLNLNGICTDRLRTPDPHQNISKRCWERQKMKWRHAISRLENQWLYEADWGWTSFFDTDQEVLDQAYEDDVKDVKLTHKKKAKTVATYFVDLEEMTSTNGKTHKVRNIWWGPSPAPPDITYVETTKDVKTRRSVDQAWKKAKGGRGSSARAVGRRKSGASDIPFAQPATLDMCSRWGLLPVRDAQCGKMKPCHAPCHLDEGHTQLCNYGMHKAKTKSDNEAEETGSGSDDWVDWKDTGTTKGASPSASSSKSTGCGESLKMLGKSSQSPSSGSHQHQQLRLVQSQQTKSHSVTNQEACGGSAMSLPTWKQIDAARPQPPWRCKPALPVRSPLHDDHSLNDEAFAAPCDAACFGEFKAWAEELNRQKPRKKGNSGEVVLQWPPLRFRSPATLVDIDRRFWRQKEERVFVCDQCGDVVRFSKVSAGTRCRFLCEFAGNYEDSSWKELDYSLRWNAWNMGLIDARWFCQRMCGQHPTLE